MIDVIVTAQLSEPEDLVYTLDSLLKVLHGVDTLTVVGLSDDSVAEAINVYAARIKKPKPTDNTAALFVKFNAYKELDRLFKTYKVAMIEADSDKETVPALLNIAVEDTDQPWLVFMDAGTVVSQRWNNELLAGMQRRGKNPTVGLCGRLAQINSNKIVSTGVLSKPTVDEPLVKHRGMGEQNNENNYNLWIECVYLPREFMAIDREAFLKAEGFDPSYNLALFEFSMAENLRKQGSIFYEPGLKLWVRNNLLTRLHSSFNNLSYGLEPDKLALYKKDLLRFCGVKDKETAKS